MFRRINGSQRVSSHIELVLQESLPGSSGLVPAIHVRLAEAPHEDVDAGDKPRIRSGDWHDDDRGDSVSTEMLQELIAPHTRLDFPPSICNIRVP